MGWSHAARVAAARARHLKHPHVSPPKVKHPRGLLPHQPAVPKYKRDRLLQAHRHLKLPRDIHRPILNAIAAPSTGGSHQLATDEQIVAALQAAARAEARLRSRPGSLTSITGQHDAQKRMINHLERYQAFLRELRRLRREHRISGSAFR